MGNAPVIYEVCAINNVKTVMNLLEWDERIRKFCAPHIYYTVDLYCIRICIVVGTRDGQKRKKKLDDKMFWKIEIFLCYIQVLYRMNNIEYFIWFLCYYLCENSVYTCTHLYTPYLLRKFCFVQYMIFIFLFPFFFEIYISVSIIYTSMDVYMMKTM